MGQATKAEAPKPGDPDQAQDNLRIWKIAEVTDPRHTKEVSFGRKMTSIDSYYQIKRATEAFGPWGQGWGYVIEEDVLNVGPMPMAKVKMIFWYMDEDGERVQCSPIIAMNRLALGEKGADEEAFKKATTDALTKSLSYLGFSADVFMGLFDDSKYVNQIRKQHEQKDQTQAAEYKLPKILTDAVAEVKTLKAQDAFAALKEKVRPEIERMTDQAAQRYVKLQFRRKELELWPEMPDDENRKADVAA